MTQGAEAATWRISPRPDAPLGTTGAALLPSSFTGERFCNKISCVAIATTAADLSSIVSLTNDPRVVLESIPEAHKVYFAKSTYDIESRTFESVFPGSADVAPSSSISLFVVVFKSYPQQAWLDELTRAGLSVMEPLPPMGYQVYGSRSVLNDLASRKSYIYAFADIPAGVGRFGVSEGVDPGVDTAISTSVVAVGEMAILVRERLMSMTGRAPAEIFSTGAQVAFDAELTNAEAVTLSRMPEVISVHRNLSPAIPSDERYNRIVAGDFQSFPTAWQTGSQILPNPNTSPYYWDRYLQSLSTLGINPANEKLGFLDTGIDDGLVDGGNNATCPPHLGTPQSCNLFFVTDLTTAFDHDLAGNLSLTSRGDDWAQHGSITTAIAAGLQSGNPGRDTHGWAFTQGVAAGAKVALARSQMRCRPDRAPYGQNQFNWRFDQERYLGYSTNALNFSFSQLGASTASPNPDQPGTYCPGVRLFNHSWNIYYSPPAPGHDPDPSMYGYTLESQFLDKVTRRLSYATWDFGGGDRVDGGERTFPQRRVRREPPGASGGLCEHGSEPSRIGRAHGPCARQCEERHHRGSHERTQ